MSFMYLPFWEVIDIVSPYVWSLCELTIREECTIEESLDISSIVEYGYDDELLSAILIREMAES